MSLSDEVQSAGRLLETATEVTLADLLNSALNKFLGWPYQAISGRVVDQEGTCSGRKVGRKVTVRN